MLKVRELIEKLSAYPEDSYVYSYEDCLVVTDSNTYKYNQLGCIEAPEDREEVSDGSMES